MLVDIDGHWLRLTMVLSWGPAHRTLKCHSVAFSSCKKVRETISALTSTPWAMYPTNSCMRRVVCHSWLRTPTIVHQELEHFLPRESKYPRFPTLQLELNSSGLADVGNNVSIQNFLKFAPNPEVIFQHTVAKATHWVAKAWRGAWDEGGPLLKWTQL